MSKQAKRQECDHRLAIFVPTLNFGGVERVTLNLAAGFAAKGFSVDLVVADARGHLRELVPPRVRIVDLTSSRVFASLPGLVRYLRRERPTVLIAAMSHSSVVSLWARKLAGVPTRIIATEHTNLSLAFKKDSRLRVRLLHFFMRRCLSSADEIVAVSNGVAEDLAVLAHLPRQEIKVIYNPVLCDEFFEKAQESVDHPWFAHNEPPVILGVGRLAIEKGFDVLIRAFARIRQQRPAKLMILGEGDQRPNLEALSRELGVDKDVCLAGYEQNPYAYIARAGAFVLTSRYEGFGLVLVEALALGVPIVSTDCESGPHEILQAGRYGTLVPVDDVESLSGAILSVLNQGRRSVPWDWLQNFDVDRVVEAYEELFVRSKQNNTAAVTVSQD